MKKLLLVLLAVFLWGAGCGCIPLSAPAGDGNAEDKLAGIPEEKLPFPRKQVKQVWRIDDRFVLVEQVQNQDNAFFLYDRSEEKAACIVGFAENARYEGRKGGTLMFIAKGDGDCGDYSFPYRLVCRLGSREMPRGEPLFLPATQGVAFGAVGAWTQVLCKAEPGGREFTFKLEPQEGQVLAGGHKKPLTTVGYDPKANELVFRFYNVEPGPGLVLGEPVTVPGHRFVEEYRIEALPAGREPEDPALLKQDFPYGLNLADTGTLSGQPSVRVALKLRGNLRYSVVSLLHHPEDGSKTILEYIVSFRPDNAG
ncbi:MAG: hypothetical protein QME13_05760 [Thermoanaerobacteraceae bacterium]|jgi:hypothetical protein|nr:hypothetical protein [Thermoanaerobacteraceae bacterium]